MAKVKKDTVKPAEVQEPKKEQIDRTQPGWSNTKPGSPQATPIETKV